MRHSDRHAPRADVPVTPRLYRHPHGITAVDVEYLYAGHAAAHVIVDSGHAAIVDVGTNDSVPYVLAARLRAVEDGERVRLGARTLELVHTPGHAAHHYVVVDAAHRSIFTGDTFGISYRALDTARGNFITPSTVPTQFDPQQHLDSIDRMLGYGPESMYLMHFSRVTDVARLAASLKEQIRSLAAMARAHAAEPDPAAGIRADMLALWLKLARAHGSTLPDAAIEHALAGDLTLNTQGLMAWLARIRDKAVKS